MLSRRMLIVDDDPDLQGILQECRTYRGYRVEIPKITLLSYFKGAA
jgi:DNA-binding response OmpR family regulator